LSGKELLRIGRIIGAHGLQGRLKILMLSDIPERFEQGNTVYLGNDESSREFAIRQFHVSGGRECLLALEGLEDRDDALSLKGQTIYIERKTAEETRGLLEEGSFYYYDLIGCEVFRDGVPFGRVKDIFEAGAGEILIIEDNKGMEIFIPFVDDIVDTAAIADKRIDIHPIEGMIENADDGTELDGNDG
jgi:16S rRNA processing protein RimM